MLRSKTGLGPTVASDLSPCGAVQASLAVRRAPGTTKPIPHGTRQGRDRGTCTKCRSPDLIWPDERAVWHTSAGNSDTSQTSMCSGHCRGSFALLRHWHVDTCRLATNDDASVLNITFGIYNVLSRPPFRCHPLSISSAPRFALPAPLISTRYFVEASRVCLHVLDDAGQTETS